MYDDEEKPKAGSDLDTIRDLVNQCIMSHNEEVLVNLIMRLEKDYIEIARLTTMGDYKASWTHREVLDYITYYT